MRRIGVMLVGAVLCGLAFGGAGACGGGAGVEATVGSKKFPESKILGEIGRLIMKEGGASVDHQRGLGGTRVCWEALVQGDIDAYPDYTGTLNEEIFPDRDLSDFEDLRAALAEAGIRTTRPLGFSNNYALAMKRQRAQKLGVDAISDLRDHPNLTFAFSNEFMDREDGWPALRRDYGFEGYDVQAMNHNLAYQSLESGSVDVVVVYTTDAKIEKLDLEVLEDDRNTFPTYEAVFLYRESVAQSHPEIVGSLERLEGRISTDAIKKLNLRVDERGESVRRVASDFLGDEFGATAEVTVESLVSRVTRRTWEHLVMVLVSMLGAIAVGVPLGIWAGRQTRAEHVVLGSVGVLQTIPSLAVLVFMIPLFGTGTKPAVAALFLYSLLPIVRNTHAGLLDIPEELLESARALGLSDRDILRKIELPLAMRSILAGIKTSAVINIGFATLGAWIGAGGYGAPILTGLNRGDMGMILEGAIPAACLALIIQALLDAAERRAMPEGLRLEEEQGGG